MNASNCQSKRFKAAYMTVREMNVSKEAFAEGVGLSVSAVMQKISSCDLLSHVHTSEEQAKAGEALAANLKWLKANQAGNPYVPPEPKEQEAQQTQPVREASENTSPSSAVASQPVSVPTPIPGPSLRRQRGQANDARHKTGMPVKVKYLLANDSAGKYRFVTPAAEAVGQFDHADSLEDIVKQVKQQYAPLVVLEEIDE